MLYELQKLLTEIDKIKIGEISNASRIISNNVEFLKLEKEEDFVRIRGLSITDVVNVYNSYGYCLSSYKAGPSDSIIISLETMPKGIIIMSVRNESIKLLKR